MRLPRGRAMSIRGGMRFVIVRPAVMSVRAADSSAAVLSARERQVLKVITKGYTAEECAVLMQVSRHTVLTFVRRIYAKLNVTSRAAAIFEARQQGILPS
jgi:DNA-binding CsgD family transcriptional regulator